MPGLRQGRGKRSPYRAMLLEPGTEAFSPWFERQGDYVRATVDIVALGAEGSLVVSLITKNRKDTGNGIEVDAEAVLSASVPGRSGREWGPSTGYGLMELVRYKFSTGEQRDDAWILFRMLFPVWFDAVNAQGPFGPPP